METSSKGTAQSWQMDNRWKTMAAGKFDFGFAIDGMRKDLGIYLEEAKRNGAHLPVAELVDTFYAEVQKMGGARWTQRQIPRRVPRLGLAAQQPQRFVRVDVGEDRVAAKIDLPDPVGMDGDQPLGPDVTFKPQHLPEQGSRPQHGIAAPSPMRRHDDGAGRECGNQAVDVGSGDARHIPEQNQHSIARHRQRTNARLQRAAEAVGITGIVDDDDLQPEEDLAHRLGLVADDHHDRPRPAGERRRRRVQEKGPARDVGGQLVEPAHARRAAGGKEKSGNCGRF
jgi:hypothetical protein